MDILQPHHRDIPEQKDEDEEDEARKDQQSDENSFLRLNFQFNLNQFGAVSSWFEVSELRIKSPNSNSRPTGRQANSELD